MNPVTIIAYCAEAVTIEVYAIKLYQPRVKFFFRLLSYILIYGLMITYHSPLHVFRNTLLDLLASICIFTVIFGNHIVMGIYNSVIIEIINLMMELTVGNIASHYIFEFWKNYSKHLNYIIIVFSRIPFFCIVMILMRIQRNNKSNNKKMKIEGYISTGIVICIVGFLLVLAYLITSVPYSAKIEMLFSLALIMLALIFGLMMLLFRSIEKRNMEYTNVLLQLQKREANQMYIESINQKDEGLRILVHDIKNHLQSMAVLNEQGEKKKLSKYIDDLVRRSNLKAATDISKNKLLNAIVYRYYNQALSRKIKFSYDVRDVSIEYIEEIDTTSILCNLLDNAMEGCSGSNPFIDLIIHSGQSAGSIVISVVNSCMRNPIVDKKGKLITSKNNKTIHGYGLESVRKTAEKYGGDVNVYYLNEDETFHATVILYEGKNENTNMR